MNKKFNSPQLAAQQTNDERSESQEYRTRGTTVKKKGEKYYLYKRTSRRVPGKKKSSLIRRMQKESGADMKDLKCLSTIYLIYMDGNKIISKISDEQRKVLNQFQINLEVD